MTGGSKLIHRHPSFKGGELTGDQVSDVVESNSVGGQSFKSAQSEVECAPGIEIFEVEKAFPVPKPVQAHEPVLEPEPGRKDNSNQPLLELEPGLNDKCNKPVLELEPGRLRCDSFDRIPMDAFVINVGGEEEPAPQQTPDSAESHTWGDWARAAWEELRRPDTQLATVTEAVIQMMEVIWNRQLRSYPYAIPALVVFGSLLALLWALFSGQRITQSGWIEMGAIFTLQLLNLGASLFGVDAATRLAVKVLVAAFMRIAKKIVQRILDSRRSRRED